MKKKIKKLFCKCKNLKIISNRKGILQFGKCNKCDRYWLINTDINQKLCLSFKEYLDVKSDLDEFDRRLSNEKED